MSLGLNGSSAGSGTGEYAIGTYTGTGTAVTLTFDKPPKAIIVQGYMSGQGNNQGDGHGTWIDGQAYISCAFTSGYGNAALHVRGTVTVSGNEITLPKAVSYSSSNTYSYIAFF